MLFAALSALSLASAAAAQSVQVVQVGATATTQGGIFQFIPPSIQAKNGTVVSFQFTGVPGNHTVTQSSFTSPCNPLSGGFDSGWVQILMPAPATPEFNLTITDDTKPLWFYCKQLVPQPHCSSGMVGAINAPATGNTFQAFQSAARAFQGPSGQGVGNLVGVGASASAPVGPVESPVVTFGSPNAGSASTSASATSAASGSATASSPASGSATATSAPSASAPPVSAPSASDSATSPTSSSAAAPSPSSAAASHGVASSVIALLTAALGFAMV